MNINIENLVVEFEYLHNDPLDGDEIGNSYITISASNMRNFLTSLNFDWKEEGAFGTIPYDEDNVDAWISRGADDSFRTNHSDLHIIFFQWAREFSGEDSIYIEYEGENPFWLIHDICHSKKDVSSGSMVVVSGGIEEERIYDAIVLCQELGYGLCVTGDLLYRCFEASKERFGHIMDLRRMFEQLNNPSC